MQQPRGSSNRGRGRSFLQLRSQSASSTDQEDNWRRSQVVGSGERARGRGGFRGGRGFNAERTGVGQFPRRIYNNEEAGRGIIPDRNTVRRNEGFQDQDSRVRDGCRDYTPKPMTYGRLKSWSEMTDAGELVLFMSSQRQQLETFLNQPSIKTDWLTLLVKSVSHAITAQHQRESVKQLLDNLCTTRFFEHFGTYIIEKQLLGGVWTEAEEFFQSLVNIMEEVLNKLPQYAVKCSTGASSLLNNAPCIESIQSNKILQDAITDVSKRAKAVYTEEMKRQNEGSFFGNNESDKPLDNFIDIPVVPTASDLIADANHFVRSAKIMGEYDDVEHYLDIQFRLMRQDFILPLREGIVGFKKNGCNKNYNCSDLRMYFDVHIVGNVFKDGIDHILQFDISKLKNVKWELSKRLIFGSLLCLSKDNFETVLFATVAHRDAKDLTKGTVNVNFKTGLGEVFNSTSSDVYIMAETTSYFESYCHVLEGLKEMSKTLPLQDYIIKCKKEIRPPRYLLPSGGLHIIPTYDLSALTQSKAPLEVPVLTTVKWPDTDVMCLNKSQKDAAILALTKELAVIQGPPGTGKTYVGLKVMQVLIENMTVISRTEEISSPILVVCYTNHALDQFLEGVLEFCPNGIIRVGGKNSSEKLEQFNIKNLKQKLRNGKLFSNLSVRRSIYECLKELEDVSSEIKHLNETMDSLEMDVVPHLHLLHDVMKESHYQSLIKQSSQPGQHKISIRGWLNASNNTAKTMIPQMIQKHLAMLVLQWKEFSHVSNLTADMTIFQRASFYHYYLDLYKQDLFQERQFILSQGIHSILDANRIKEIQECLITASRRILPDTELERVIPNEVLNRMLSFTRSSGRQEASSHEEIVETWLLGFHKNLHSQLDDVQMLTSALAGEMTNSEMFDDDDDASRRAQNDRILDEDDDDDGHKSYNARSKAAMDNMSSVIRRADMLGIKENILMEDGNRDENVNGGAWKTVNYPKPMTFIKFQMKMKTIKPMTEEMESRIENVLELDLDQRFALYNLWIKKYKEIMTSNMTKLIDRYTSAYERKKEANMEEVLFLLRSAKVIGMTTTGAAKHRAVLQSVGCRIIVVEEAAEVLESHIVTSLNKNCKHLILIGDHQQLRPSPTVFLLAKEFGLEISLFERLIKNKVPHVLLKEQHRMRPEISKIMLHIYPDLQDHVSVKSYDNICGVTKNMFFIQHEHEETHVDDTKSRANIHEAEFLVAFCEYLLNQGYSESEITVLATYAGQVYAIKKIMKDTGFNHKVRVTAVDNFQGEENEIILLSLVRSNTENNVGFLKVDNRVCVALSRARKGLFVTGNFDLLASKSTLWKKIVETVKQEQLIGDGLPVVCQNHPQFFQTMTCAEDFKKCPHGGCGQDCEYKLKCGHVCARKCHGYDLQHVDYQCLKNCGKQCVNGHPCHRRCYQDCGDCIVKVQKQIPACGHDDDVPCSVPPITANCSQKCDFMLDCEHSCSGRCGWCRINRKHEKCLIPITYSWPCGHSATVPCYMKPTLYLCQKECGVNLECGHKCGGKCSECLQGSVHVACVKKCMKQLPCGHKCPSYCGVPCLPCTEVCPAQCRHSACFTAKPQLLCSHTCAPCKEPCVHQCGHDKCRKLCSDVCDFEICLMSCKGNVQKCNHQCSGLCGEMCVCAKCENISILHVDNKTGKELLAHGVGDEKSFAQNDGSVTKVTLVNENEGKLQENKNKSKKKKRRQRRLVIKIPSCHHVFYVDELDKYVMNFDPDGSSYIFCPVCSKPILKCMRYENNNKERHKKREREKSKLQLVANITKNQLMCLHRSQKLLEDSVFMSGFRSINITSLKNQLEMQAVSFQLKCAFMLSEIISLVETSLSPTQLFRSHKDSVLAIKRLTSQQKSEFTTELLRCFWEFYLIHLQSLASRHDIEVPQELINNVKEMNEELKKLKPKDDVLVRAQHVADILRRRIKEITTEETVKAKCLLLEEASARAVKVMQSRDENMLFDLIGGEMEKTLKATFSYRGAELFGLGNSRMATSDDLFRERLKKLTESMRYKTKAVEKKSRGRPSFDTDSEDSN